MTGKQGSSPESIVREIKRQTRRKFTAEEKIRIVLEGLRGEAGITDLCRKEGIHPTMYDKWSKTFLEAGKRQLNGDTIRMVEESSLGVKRSLREMDVPRSSFYEWYGRYVACFISHELKKYLETHEIRHVRMKVISSDDPGEDRTLPPVDEEPDPFGQLLCTRRVDRKDPGVGGILQSPAVSRGHRQRDPRGQVLRKGPRDPEKEGKGPPGDHEDEEGVEPDGDA
jgi:transposase